MSETTTETEMQPLFYDAASLPDSVRIAADLSEDEGLMQTDDLYELRIEKEDGSGRAMVSFDTHDISVEVLPE